jgi:hypothetical protein
MTRNSGRNQKRARHLSADIWIDVKLDHDRLSFAARSIPKAISKSRDSIN